MDIDKHDFLAEIVVRLVSLPGDPVEEINSAVATVVAAHSIRLIMIARAHRAELLRLAERQCRRTNDPSKLRQ